jgi:hypothetical protein
VHLKGLVQLQSLDLSGTEVTGPGLVNLTGMTRLRKLMLAGRGLAVEAGEALSMMGRHQAVYSLDDAALRHLRGLVNLQTLDLSQRTISDAALVHLHGLRQLRDLGLRHTGTTDTGIKELQGALPECNIRR